VALDPAIVGLYPNADPPGSFHVEVYRAVKGERQGKWRIVAGQDVDPGPTEIMWGRTGVPAGIEAIRDVNLGYLFKPNGNSGKMKNEKLDAYNIEHFLIDEKDLQAAAAVAERT
jgi:hypothetical protein